MSTEDPSRIDFHKVTIEDKEWIDQCLAKSNYNGCEYSFSNIFFWGTTFEFRVAHHKGFLIIKTLEYDKAMYYFPAGEGDLTEVIEDLIAYSQSRGEVLTFGNVTKDHISIIEQNLPYNFEYEEIDGATDYIYLREKMVSLAGKKLHGKRNHINRFKDNPNWSFEWITKDNLSECYAMSVVWSLDHFGGLTENSDFCAVQKAFDYFEESELVGGLLRQEGKVIAFTMGAPLNSNTYVIHIEKAFPEIQGAYPMINQQFAMNMPDCIEYINREEDLGQEGLRKSKLSYYPEILLNKYKATLK
jgi:hypothetical protein